MPVMYRRDALWANGASPVGKGFLPQWGSASSPVGGGVFPSGGKRFPQWDFNVFASVSQTAVKLACATRQRCRG